MSELLLIGSFQVKDGHYEQFAQVAKKIMGLVSKEPGIARYDWHVNDAGEAKFVEIYKSSEAVVEHVMGEAGAALPEIFEHIDIVGIDLYGEPSAKAREAMAAFPITYRGAPAFTTK